MLQGNATYHEQTRCLISDKNGEFIFERQDEPMALSVSAVGYLPRSYAFGKSDPSTIVLTLIAGGAEVTGSVLDALGGPIGGAHIEALTLSEGAAIATTTTSADGALRLTVPIGPVRVSASADGYSKAYTTVQAPSRNADVVLVPQSTVTGHVVWADTTDPVPNVTVIGTRKDITGPRTAKVTTMTDEVGAFHLDALTAGQYELLAVSANSRSAPFGLRVGVGETVDSIEIEVSPATSLSVTVHVDGQACPDSTVEATGPTWLFSATNSGGIAELQGVVPGSYEVRVDCPSALSLGKRVVVANRPVSETFDLESGFAIRGTVEGSNGKRLTHALVSASPVEAEDPMPARPRAEVSCLTNEKGEFECSGLNPGQYECSASLEGRVSGQSVRVSVGRPGSPSWIELRIDPVGTIVVRLEGAKSKNLGPTEIFARRTGEYPATATREGEQFIFSNLPLGEYEVFYGASAGEPQSPKATVVLDQGDQVKTVSLSIGTPSALEGHVVDERGMPVPEAWVRVSNAEEGGVGMETVAPVLSGSTGEFTVNDLLPGKYDIRVTDGDREAVVYGVAVGGSDIVVQMLPAAQVSVRIITVGGDLVPTFILQYQLVEEQELATRVNVGGRLGFWSASNLRPGTYLLRATSELGDAEARVNLSPGGKSEITLVVREPVPLRSDTANRNAEPPVVEGAAQEDPPSRSIDGEHQTKG